MGKLIKKVFAYTLVLAVALGTFVACSSDDNNDSTGGGLAAKVAGTYTGNFVSLSFEGNTDVVVTVAGDNEALITFDTATGIAPFEAKLLDTGVQEIIQTGVGSDPMCQFQPQTSGVIINGSSQLFTFSGQKK